MYSVYNIDYNSYLESAWSPLVQLFIKSPVLWTDDDDDDDAHCYIFPGIEAPGFVKNSSHVFDLFQNLIISYYHITKTFSEHGILPVLHQMSYQASTMLWMGLNECITILCHGVGF